MKKMLAIVAVLTFVTGAMAATVTLTDGGVDENGLVTVGYTYDGEDAPVAFGLVVASDVSISAVAVPAFYDVFIDSAYTLGDGYTYPGEGTSTGIPTAQVGVAGELALPATDFAISAGGLKDGETDMPPQTEAEQFFTLQIADFGSLAEGSYDIVIAADDVRGGVVSEAGAFDVVGVTITVEVSASSVCYGDANGDGKVNLTDVNTLVVTHLVPLAPAYEMDPVTPELAHMDINGDGKLNLIDANTIVVTYLVPMAPSYEIDGCIELN